MTQGRRSRPSGEIRRLAGLRTVDAESDVTNVAKTFLDHRISAAPVVDRNGVVLGAVSEGDLMRRARSAHRRSWWLSLRARHARSEIKHGKLCTGVARLAAW